MPLFLLTACSSLPDLPDAVPSLIHKIEIQQGNIIRQEMLNKLKPGMRKRQVKFIMGSPMINDTFHTSRWDYLYRVHRSGSEPKKTTRVTLFFEGDALMRVEGNMRPEAETEADKEKKALIVDVPAVTRQEDGIVDKALKTLRIKDKDE